MAKNKVNNGDIVLLSDGRMFRIVDVTPSYDEMIYIQFVDRDELSFVEYNRLDIEANLGKDPQALAMFHSIRGIHLRLNRMNQI